MGPHQVNDDLVEALGNRVAPTPFKKLRLESEADARNISDAQL